MMTRMELMALYKDANAQYHALATGRSPSVYVDQNGERVEYNRVNMADLRAYIRGLEMKLGLGGCMGAIGVWM